MKKISIFLILLIVFVSCGDTNESESQSKKIAEATEKTTNESESQSKKIAEATEVINIASLMSEFEKNEISATTKYRGKEITVSGVADTVGYDLFTNVPQIVLNDGGLFSFAGVECNLADQGQASGIQAGDQIEVTGILTEYVIHVVLSNCKVN